MMRDVRRGLLSAGSTARRTNKASETFSQDGGSCKAHMELNAWDS